MAPARVERERARDMDDTASAMADTRGDFAPKQEHEQQPPPQKKHKLDGDDEFDEEKQKNFLSTHARRAPSDYDSEEEDRFYNDGLRRMTAEEVRRYNELVGPSEGFDAPELPENLYVCGLIHPLGVLNENSQTFKEIKSCSISAIAEYNAANGTSNEFLKVAKANVRVAGGYIYYITFEAQAAGADAAADGSQSVETFEACVFAGVTEISVEFCRLKRKF